MLGTKHEINGKIERITNNYVEHKDADRSIIIKLQGNDELFSLNKPMFSDDMIFRVAAMSESGDEVCFEYKKFNKAKVIYGTFKNKTITESEFERRAELNGDKASNDDSSKIVQGVVERVTMSSLGMEANWSNFLIKLQHDPNIYNMPIFVMHSALNKEQATLALTRPNDSVEFSIIPNKDSNAILEIIENTFTNEDL